jgi:magnesium chelatase family protein
MLARATAATPWGIEARSVDVEADVQNGLPQMQIVGLPDTAVRESRERVRAAIRNCGFPLPPRSIVVNLAPADIRKAGNHLDLAIALSLLTAFEQLPPESLKGRLFCGELGLDGAVRPIRGGLAIADLGRTLGARELILPTANAGEAAALDALPVIGVDSLSETLEHLIGVRRVSAAPAGRNFSGHRENAAADRIDLSEVRGQETAKRCLEIAAGGGHNLLFIGPPGAGKTMLARCLPSLLPPLSLVEATELTKIVSMVSDRPPSGLVERRPFRSPHTGTSTAAMIGGGSVPKPGEVSLAHTGVLFLDELPEFGRDALEALRQPLEGGSVTVVRMRASLSFPARFALLAAMNPCPCGHHGDRRNECYCSPLQVENYRRRVSGPLLDRIDLHVEVPALELEDLRSSGGESSRTVAARVLEARSRQRRRLSSSLAVPSNAAMGNVELRKHCQLDSSAQSLLDSAFEKLGLSARALTRILKVARTIADLSGVGEIGTPHIAEAIQYRSLDRRMTQ